MADGDDEAQVPSTVNRILAAAGIAAGAAWAGAVIYCGGIRPGYDPVTQFVSELAERGSSTETVMRVTGFYLPAVLVLAFAAFLIIRSAGRFVAALLIINGIGRLTTGMFPCDPGCPVVGASVSQAVHNVAAMMNALTFVAAAVVCSVQMWRIGRRRFSTYSLVTVMVGSGLLVMMFTDVSTRGFVGLFQRLALGVLHLWLAAFALSMRPWAKGASDEPAGAAA